MAKEYEAPVLLHDAVYQKGNRFYVKGVRTTVRCSERTVWDDSLSRGLGRKPERTGVYTIVTGVRCKPVYREFSLRYGRKPFDAVDYACSTGCYSNRPPDDDARCGRGTLGTRKWGGTPIATKRGRLSPGFNTRWKTYTSAITRESGVISCPTKLAPFV